MIKAVAITDVGPLFIFGLSHENIDRILTGDSVVFPAREIGIDNDRLIVIGVTAELPDHIRQKVCIFLLLKETVMHGLKNGNFYERSIGDAHFIFVGGGTEADVERLLRPLIDERTKVIRRGFDPSEPTSTDRN